MIGDGRMTRWRWRLLRRIPRQRHLRGTWLHRLLGDRLFDPRLWKPEPRTVAAGLAIGTFVALTPAFGAHLVLAGVAAMVFRANIPAAIVACFVSNPVTLPVILALQLQLGRLLTRPLLASLALANPDGRFVNYVWPLSLGAMVTASIAAAAVYALALRLATRLAQRPRMRRRRVPVLPAEPQEPR
jgi:hypothetical protein